MRLFVAGSANVDLTFRVPAMPRLGVTEVCPYAFGFGGKGANQAVQAARLGAEVSFLGKVGSDLFGPAIVEQLRREGIYVEHTTISPGHLTGTAVILVDAAGQNSIITHGGPNLAMTIDDVCRAQECIVSSDVVLTTLELPAEPLQELLHIARAAGKYTILNPAPPVDFPHDLLIWVDLCLPNESELAALTGLRVSTLDEASSAGQQLFKKGPKAVVLTRGDQGAVIIDASGVHAIAGCPVQAVDTSGAGDAFSAALAVALGEGQPLREAANWANRVAAISVTRAGTQSSFARRAEMGEG